MSLREISLVVFLTVASLPRMAPLMAEEPPTPARAPSANAGTEAAIEKWTFLAQQQPGNPMPWVRLGNAWMQKSREGAVGAAYDNAEKAFRQALALDTNNVEATVGLAWIYNSRHDFEQGVEWATKTLALDPRNQDAYALLGDAAVESGDYDLALEHCQQCLDIAPNLSSYSRAAHVLFLTGDARQARWLMQKAIDAGGPYAENTAWCRAQLALMLFDGGALPLAEQELDRALKATPHNRHVLGAMARIKTAQKDYDAALEFCQQALAVARDHDVLVLSGDVYTLLGKAEEAQEQYRQVIELQGGHDHGDGELHTHASDHGNALLARFYADHDRSLDEALHEAQEACEHHPNVFAIDTLAWCYYKNERYEDARQKIDEVLSRKTPKADFLFHAGMIYAKVGDRPKAQQYLYQALSLNPNFHPVQAQVAVQTLAEVASSIRPNVEP